MLQDTVRHTKTACMWAAGRQQEQPRHGRREGAQNEVIEYSSYRKEENKEREEKRKRKKETRWDAAKTTRVFSFIGRDARWPPLWAPVLTQASAGQGSQVEKTYDRHTARSKCRCGRVDDWTALERWHRPSRQELGQPVGHGAVALALCASSARTS